MTGKKKKNKTTFLLIQKTTGREKLKTGKYKIAMKNLREKGQRKWLRKREKQLNYDLFIRYHFERLYGVNLKNVFFFSGETVKNWYEEKKSGGEMEWETGDQRLEKHRVWLLEELLEVTKPDGSDSSIDSSVIA